MPAPIPPPPPQPSAEETRHAVRLTRRVALIAAVFFGLWASTYRYDSFLVDYGRDDGHSWVVWRARQLDEDALRAHEGGRVAWMIGSSIMRDSFDEAVINDALAASGSPWRVFKLGMPRGTAGLSVGLLDELPIRSGDRVLHTVAMDNFRRDWITHTGIPEERVARFLGPRQMAAVADYSVQARIAYLSGVPYDFYRYHEPTMIGAQRWLAAVWWLKAPRKKRPGYFLTFRDIEEGSWTRNVRRLGAESSMYFAPGDIDFSDAQFNVAGLQAMRAWLEQAGVPLSLIDVPYRPEYRSLLLSEEARQAWAEWREDQPELVGFPELPDDHYYDMRHPNSRGRAVLTERMVAWLSDL